MTIIRVARSGSAIVGGLKVLALVAGTFSPLSAAGPLRVLLHEAAAAGAAAAGGAGVAEGACGYPARGQRALHDVAHGEGAPVPAVGCCRAQQRG